MAVPPYRCPPKCVSGGGSVGVGVPWKAASGGRGAGGWSAEGDTYTGDDPAPTCHVSVGECGEGMGG